MKRSRLFLENFIIYGIGGGISKIIPFIMLPIITRFYPNSYYIGISDIATIVVTFGSSLAGMGMYDAMFRMFFDDDKIEYKKSICSSAFFFVLSSSAIIALGLILLRNISSQLIFGESELRYLIIIIALNIMASSLSTIISAPTRMQNKRHIYLIINTVSPVISYTIALLLLKNENYLLALPLSSFISILLIVITFSLLNRGWFSIKSINFTYIKQMLIIALPLMPNFLIYWIFNSCDRFMISFLIGTEYTGIYAIGAKFGHISQLIYSAFAGGWQYFAFSTMKSEDQVEMTSKIFEYLGLISFIATLCMITINKPLFQILFTEEYHAAYLVAPYLFLSPLLLMLYQIASNQFIVIKKTWPSMCILLFGAIVNIAANGFLIPAMGIEGAGIATLAGYIISVIITVLVLNYMKLLKLSRKFIALAFLFAALFFLWRSYFVSKFFLSVLFILFYSVLCCIAYKADILRIVKKK